jgi:hypothetical protein
LAKLYFMPLTVSRFLDALYLTVERIRLAGSTRLMPASINPTALARRLEEISSSLFLMINTNFLNKRYRLLRRCAPRKDIFGVAKRKTVEIIRFNTPPVTGWVATASPSLYNPANNLKE